MKEHDHVFDSREICAVCFRERTEIEDEVDVGASCAIERAAFMVEGLVRTINNFPNRTQETIAREDAADLRNKLFAANARLEKLAAAETALATGHTLLAELPGHSILAEMRADRDKLAAEVIRLRAGSGPRVVVDYED